jgi:glycosyltransferase involved in cell wall biosynthesis
VLLTSINEGTPTSLIEAMFAARPFVATDAGGTADLAVELRDSAKPVIRQAGNGFIVEQDAEAITESLAQLQRDPALGIAMGSRGHGHAMENWSSTRLLAEVEALYRDLTNSAKATAQAV